MKMEKRNTIEGMKFPEQLNDVLRRHPYPLLFATISGAHLYGFESKDSDYDVRGVHLLPLRELVGLNLGQETVNATTKEDGVEVDLVTHETKKFFLLLLSRNGYVLEQLYSPLVLKEGPYFSELREIGMKCITRHHVHHYLGFAENQWELFQKEKPAKVKPLLYVYRVLLTGIHLMTSGKIEANLVTLNADFRLPFIGDLITLKQNGCEKELLPETHLEHYEREYIRLRLELEKASQHSELPEKPLARDELHELLLRTRLEAIR